MVLRKAFADGLRAENPSNSPNFLASGKYLTIPALHVASWFTHSRKKGPWKQIPCLPCCLSVLCFIFRRDCVGLHAVLVGLLFNVRACKSRAWLSYVFFGSVCLGLRNKFQLCWLAPIFQNSTFCLISRNAREAYAFREIKNNWFRDRESN